MSVTTQYEKLLAKLKSKKHYYEATFNTQAGKEVLRDLAISCFADRSTYDNDQRKSDKNAGRREVFLEIMTILKRDLSELERTIKDQPK